MVGAEVSAGNAADHPAALDGIFSDNLRTKFEIYSYRNAAAILHGSFPEQFAEIVAAMEAFSISKTMIRMPGGSKGPIARYVDTLFADHWEETRISADLHVKLTHAKQDGRILSEYVRKGFLDGHRIDFVSGKVALDLEWNSKDQTCDRDLQGADPQTPRRQFGRFSP